MTPIFPYRNVLTGAPIPDYDRETPDTGATERLRQLGLFAQARRQAEIGERDRSAAQLLTQGHARHGEAVLGTFEEVDLDRLERMRDDFLRDAHEGNRQGYFNALQLCYVLLHYSLNDPSRRSRAPRYIEDFVSLSEEYDHFLGANSNLSPPERFRYLFAASQIGRTMLGRLASEVNPLTGDEGLQETLRANLNFLYDRLLGHHQALLTADPNAEPFTGILRQIQVRRALLAGDTETARQRALDLADYYESHPPPAAESEDAERNRWDHVAARAWLRDGEIANLLGGMEVPAVAEDVSATLNGISYEILQVLASTIDMVNEDGEEDIRNRYTALSAAVTTLSLTRPGFTLNDILEALAETSGADAIRREMEAAATANPTLQRLLTQARGERDLDHLIERARAAATHVRALRDGPGGSLMQPLFEENGSLNQIATLSRELGNQEGLAAALNFQPDNASPLPFNIQFAIALLRRGPVAAGQVRALAAANPQVSMDNILAHLENPADSQALVNQLVEHLMENYQTELSEQPDHVVAAVHSVMQVLSQTGRISSGVSLNSALRNQAAHLVEELQGYSFQTSRAFHHLSSPSSVLTLVSGILLSEFLPAWMIHRASSTGGRLAAGGVELVNMGRLTFAGNSATGLGTGLVMSVIGTSLSTQERSAMGLRTHFGRDLAISAGVNTLTFGATIPFSRWWSRTLTPTAADAHAAGRLTGWRRIAYQGGTLAFATGSALLLNAGARYGMTGEFTTSYQEVAENILAMLAWELGSAGVRRVRQRLALSAEIQGLDPIQLDAPDPTATQSQRLGRRIGRVLARPVNIFLTSLGRQRAARVGEVADRIVREMIEFYRRQRLPEDPDVAIPEDIRRHRFWDFISRQIALQEIVSPGSLDQYHDAFFALHHPMIAGVEGSYRLVFIPRRPTFPEFTGILMPPPNSPPQTDPPSSQDPSPPSPISDPQAAAPATVDRGSNPVQEMPAVQPEEVAPLPAADDSNLPLPPASTEATFVGALPDLFVLPRGQSLTAVEPNQSGNPRRGHHFFATEQGEVFAFTEVGYDKHSGRLGEGINEDAYGIVVDATGRTTLVVADGMGGYGGGDIASELTVQSVLGAAHTPVHLSQALLNAHQAINLSNRPGGTCATACRVHHDGTVEVAQAGDTMVYVLRRQSSGGFRVHRAFLPANLAGNLRGMGDPQHADTISMNASPNSHIAIGGLGLGRSTPPVTRLLQHGVPHGIFEGMLSLPSQTQPGQREPVVLRPGDGLLLVSDGIGDIFDSAQLSQTTSGSNLTQVIGEGLYSETLQRLDLFVRTMMLPPGRRIRIAEGSFAGNYAELGRAPNGSLSGTEIYDAPTGGRHIGHIHGDNITAVLFRYLGLGHLPPR